jgi:hypothetical protein
MTDVTRISRREALAAVGGAGLALAGLGGTSMALFGTEAAAQPRQQPPRGSGEAQKVGPDFYLTRRAVQAAQRFRLGKKTAALRLDTAEAHALVKDLPLEGPWAKKVGANEVVMEAVACGIVDPASVAAIRGRLKQLKAPDFVRDSSVFYFIRSGRRLYRDKAGALELHKQHKTEGERSFILGITHGREQPILTFLPEGLYGMIGWAGPPLKGGKPTPEPEPEEPDSKDFAECVMEFLNAVPSWVSVAIGGICGVCIAACGAATLPGSQPVTIPFLIGTCAACVLAAATLLGLSLFVCGEHFETD